MFDLIDLSPESDMQCKPTYTPGMNPTTIENNNQDKDFPLFYQEKKEEPKNNSKFEVLVSVPRQKTSSTSNHARKRSRFSVHVYLE